MLQNIVADERRWKTNVAQVNRRNHLALLRLARSLALFFHEPVEVGCVHRETSLTSHQLGQVERETVRIVQLESQGARETELFPEEARRFTNLSFLLCAVYVLVRRK